MGYRNRKSPDHGKPMPKVNFHHQHHAPVSRAPGKTSGSSNRMPPVFYVIFLGIAALAMAALAH
jgi:hypothetical protein